MVNRLKGNVSLTLVEVLIAMFILSTSTAGVLGSFSYAFKLILRAGKKAEAMNYGRKAQEAFRAIWLYKSDDPRLADQTAWTDIKTAANPNLDYLVTGYDGVVYYMITPGDVSLPGGSQQISIKVDWNAP